MTSHQSLDDPYGATIDLLKIEEPTSNASIYPLRVPELPTELSLLEGHEERDISLS